MRLLWLAAVVFLGIGPAFSAPADWFASLSAERRLEVQAALALVGHYDGVIDGIYGPSTDRAIRTFELHEGAAPDGQLSSSEFDALTGEASDVFSRLDMAHVTDNRTGLSPFISRALLSVTQQTDSGTMYSTPDRGLSFETIRVQRRAGVSFNDVLHSLEHYGDGSHVTYSKVSSSMLVAAGAAATFSYYIRMRNDGGFVTGYRVVWTANYASEGTLLSIFAFSPVAPNSDSPAAAPKQATLSAMGSGERVGSFLLPTDRPEVVILDGDITSNGALDFIRALKVRPTAKEVWLNSNGGLVTQGLLIAHELHTRGLGTEVAAGSGCYSACAYIFFAGVRRIDNGELGVHQIYGDGVTAEAAQMSLSDVLDELRDFDVSESVISVMLRTPPAQIHVFSKDEVLKLGINKPTAPETVSTPATQSMPVPDNVTTVAKTDRAAPQTEEKRVTVYVETPLYSVLEQLGVDGEVASAIDQIAGPKLSADGRVPSPSDVLVLFGPAQSGRSLPYRVSIYLKKNGGASEHIVTVALSDRGSYVLGLDPRSATIAPRR